MYRIVTKLAGFIALLGILSAAVRLPDTWGSAGKKAASAAAASAAAASAAVSVTVDDTRPGAVIPADFLGLSYEITALTDTVYFRWRQARLRNLINNLGEGTLRLNGYYGNFVPWTSRTRTLAMTKGNNNYQTDTVASSDLDSLFAFMRTTKWKVILGVNAYHSSPAAALAELQYAWAKGKDVIRAFEIGNEPDGLYKSNYDEYRKVAMPYFELLKKELPDAPVCGPASLHPELFIKDFIRQDADKVNFITVHEYPVGDSKTPESVYQLLDDKYARRAADFSRAVDSMCRQRNVRYRIGECNSFGDEGPGVADRFAAALWGLDYMFTVAANHAMGVNFHGGSRNFTPIRIKKNSAPLPQPLYYAMLFFHLAGQGSLLPVSETPDNPAIKAYATLSDGHSVAVTLINKDVDNDVVVHLALKGRFSGATLSRLSAPSIFSRDSITLGGSSVDRSGRWAAASKETLAPVNGQWTVTVPRASAILVKLK
ncbi:glycosyl hydrolase family 79 C-terminal domain-containing protein [Puia sp.]|uniref:glycosyl hydrolase family 79 C-terminal domain-containing protein n=1 Tax=Puia sp. TaxID=2045100 RepID=UPI002F3FC985